MKKRQILLINVVLAMFCLATVANAATTLTKLGHHPVVRPPLTSVADLQKMAATSGKLIEQGFNTAGYPQLYTAFNEHVSTAAIETINVTQGEKLQWMMFRRNGAGPVRIARNLVWGGKKPFKAFRFDIVQDNNRYQIIVPAICGNISLKDITPVPPEVVVTPEPTNQAPTCNMQVSKQQVYCGQHVTVDASGSSDSDGSIKSTTFTLTDSDGQVVEQKEIDASPFTTQIKVPCGGTYVLEATVTDNQGASATSSACKTELTGKRRLIPVAALGFMHLWDPAELISVRGGLEYRIDDNWSLMGLLGYNIHLSGRNGDDAFSADALLHYNFSRYFVGGGIGFWNMDDDSRMKDVLDGSNVDLIFQAGARVIGTPNAFNVSLFGEHRIFADNLDEPGVSSRSMLGLLFKF